MFSEVHEPGLAQCVTDGFIPGPGCINGGLVEYGAEVQHFFAAFRFFGGSHRFTQVFMQPYGFAFVPLAYFLARLVFFEEMSEAVLFHRTDG